MDFFRNPNFETPTIIQKRKCFPVEFCRQRADNLSADILNHRNSTSHNLFIPVIVANYGM